MSNMLPHIPPSASVMMSKVEKTRPNTRLWKRDEFSDLAEDGFPIPPAGIMQYGQSPERHIESGKRDSALLFDIRERFAMDGNVLEFGCGNGRVVRWLAPLAERNEVWGVDIDAERLMWAAMHLHPIQFCTMATYGSLPFKDEFFSFIYAYSVFTHLDEGFTFWLQELRRLLQPGSYLFITLLDEQTVEIAKARGVHRMPEIDTPAFVLNHGEFGCHVNKAGVINTYMRRSFFEKMTSRSFDLVEIIPTTMGLIQTGYLLRKK